MNTENATTTTPSVNLVAALSKTITPSALFEFENGMSFRLRFLPKAELKNISSRCMENRYDPEARDRRPQLNSEKFVKEYYSRSVLGWEGVTLRRIAQTANIDIEGLTEEQLDAPQPFSLDALLKMTESVSGLDDFLNKTINDISAFRPALKAETKN